MTHIFGQSWGNEQLLWDVHRLWRLAEGLPVEIVPVREFEPVLKRRRCRFWPESEAVPSYLEIATYAQRLHAADLEYPIILSAEGEVMDGMNRLTNAWTLGRETIRVVRFPVTPEPDARHSLE